MFFFEGWKLLLYLRRFSASFDHKKIKYIFQVYFISFLVIKTLDPDPDSLEILDSVPDSFDPDPQQCA